MILRTIQPCLRGVWKWQWNSRLITEDAAPRYGSLLRADLEMEPEGLCVLKVDPFVLLQEINTAVVSGEKESQRSYFHAGF